MVADDWHKTGIARLLMDALIGAARESGFETMAGLVLRTNSSMLRFARTLALRPAPMKKRMLLSAAGAPADRASRV